MDHVGGLERLFFRAYFDATLRGNIRLYAQAALVPVLRARVADYPQVLAEGGANFWDAFHLVPVSRGFWHGRVWFDVFPTRHHAPGTSFGLALRGSVVWTGDTRPIPEMLAAHAAHGEVIAHDYHSRQQPLAPDRGCRAPCSAGAGRLVLYHYGSADEGTALATRGYRVARRNDLLALTDAHETWSCRQGVQP